MNNSFGELRWLMKNAVGSRLRPVVARLALGRSLISKLVNKCRFICATSQDKASVRFQMRGSPVRVARGRFSGESNSIAKLNILQAPSW